MPMGTVAPVWRQQFCDPVGAPYANGTVEVFVAGSAAHAIVYQDQTVTVPHPWPIPLNAGGMTSEPMFLIPGSYHFYVKDAAGVVQWDDDLIAAVPPSSLDVDTPATFGEAVTLGSVVYESTGLGGKTPGLWYKTTTANDWSSSAATIVGLATADYAAGTTGFVRLVGRMTKLSGLVVGAVYYASSVPGGMTNVKPATNILQIGIPDSTSSILLAIIVAGQFQAWTPSGGIATVVGELHVGGNTTITGTVGVSGLTSLSGGLTVIGATSVQGLTATALTVNGPATLGATGVTGNLTVSGTLAVTGTSIHTGRVQIGGTTVMSASFPAWRNTGAVMEAVLGDNTQYASVRALNLFTQGSGSSFADLTITGGLTVGGTVNANGYQGRAGIGGAPTNIFNLNWTGTVQVWIDSTNVGTIQMQANLPPTPRFVTRQISSAYTAVAGDFVIVSGGTFTVTLPPAANGIIVDVKNYGSGVVTVVPQVNYLDYPNTSYVLSVPNQSVSVVCDGTNWWVR